MKLNCVKCCGAEIQVASKGKQKQEGIRDTSIRIMRTLSVLWSSYLELQKNMAATKGQEAPRHCCTLYMSCWLAQNMKTYTAFTLLKLPLFIKLY